MSGNPYQHHRHHHHHDQQRRPRENNQQQQNYYEDDRRQNNQHQHHRSSRNDQQQRYNNNNNNTNKNDVDTKNNDDDYDPRELKKLPYSQFERARETVRQRHPPRNYRCHVCLSAGSSHWICDCPILRQNRKFFPHISISRGCLICGKKISNQAELDEHGFAETCPFRSKMLSCTTCGAVHFPNMESASPPECPYSRKPSIWHEFFDDKSGLPYYVDVGGVTKKNNNNNEKETTEQEQQEVKPPPTWAPPAHAQDKVLWHCSNCDHLLPAEKYLRCPGCELSRFR